MAKERTNPGLSPERAAETGHVIYIISKFCYFRSLFALILAYFKLLSCFSG